MSGILFCPSQLYFNEMESFTEHRTHLFPPVSWQSEIPRDPPVSTSPPTLSVEVTEACNDAQPLLSVMGIELMSSCLLSNGEMKSCSKNKDVHL